MFQMCVLRHDVSGTITLHPEGLSVTLAGTGSGQLSLVGPPLLPVLLRWMG